MSDGFHPPLEEYLEAVHELEEEGVPVIQARLAERLRHSAPSVSEMTKRLKDDGYVIAEGRSLLLSPEGRRLAERVVRKHRLAERLLTDIIGLSWEKSHLEACRWEHVISDEVEERLVEILGHPRTCPHGNPIPGAEPVEYRETALCDAVGGTTVRLRRVTEQVEIDTASLTYLSDSGFVPGIQATVSLRYPDGTLTLDIDGHSVTLAPALTRQLFVSVN